MGKKKLAFILVFLFIGGIILSPAIKVSAESMPDIRDKYAKEINFLINEGIISGYPDGYFKPDRDVTREEAVFMIGEALDLKEIHGSSSFTDVDPDSFGAGHIESTHQMGIIAGYPEGEFRPDNSMTRGEMAVIIAEAFDLSAKSNYQFIDVDSDAFYAEEVKMLIAAGITAGTGNGKYRPEQPITREHYSLFVARALNPAFKVDEVSISPVKRIVKPEIGLNVRKSPGGKDIGSLDKNDVVTATKKSGKWYYVENGSIAGYVHGEYIKPLTVAIDPGHGGSDPGASGNGIIEKELNLDVAKRVKNYFDNAGIRVVMTRTTDTFIDLNPRVDYAVNHNADTFVSIHGNAFYDSGANGTETFFSSAAFDGCTRDNGGPFNARTIDSCHLAKFIQKRLVDALNTSDRGIDEKDFRVVNDTPLVSSLVELAFITNDEDASKLKSDRYKDLAAKAIYQGVMDYYKWQER
ncbi:N-acetylmuramoyl-L-alanine amidase [Virgibacillus necropolis]|uniref:N-acetylmuramoyl-L-alanine amidase n=1 Tax=Virgibacillus necropolis TaxID=163877 RepID=UPI00384AC40B